MRQDVVLSERIDRNGTKHQLVETNCSRCGGAGGHAMWAYTGTTCYKCGGHGRQQEKRKIYTPEHAEKLRKQREKREEKRLAKLREEAHENNLVKLEQWGYHTGKIYAVLGDSFSIKEELKEKGATWGGRTIGWHFPENREEYETVELDTNNLIGYNDLGEVRKLDSDNYADYVNGKKKNLEPETEWFGEVGKRMDLELTVVSSYEIDTAFGWSCINKLKDAQGNIFIWKTDRDLVYMHGENAVINLKGTIKEHSEYRGDKQTVLTRCKVKEQSELEKMVAEMEQD